MTSGGFLIPLLPRYSPQANFPVGPSPSALCRLIQPCTGDCGTDKNFTVQNQNVRFRANE